MKAQCMLAVLCAALFVGPAAAQDLFGTKDGVIRDEGKIGDRWMLAEGAQLATPVYPAHLAARGDDVCIAVGYRIDKQGKTTDFAVLRQWSSAGENEPVDGYWSAFAQSGADALSQWRFAPRPGVSPVLPTYTVATLAFNAGGDDAAVLRGNCAVQDLAAEIQQHKSRRYMTSRAQRELDRVNHNSPKPRPPMPSRR